MPKNKGLGGKKFRSSKKNTDDDLIEKILEFREENEEYGKILKTLGNLYVEVLCNDNTIIKAKIPGKFKKKLWFNIGDYVLISKRNFDDKFDIIHKYTGKDFRKLVSLGEITSEKLIDNIIDIDYDDDDENISNNDKSCNNNNFSISENNNEINFEEL